MMTEKQVENAILEFLNANEIYCWKNDSVGIYDQRSAVFRKRNSPYFKRGVSDIIGILPGGKMLAIEVKRPKLKGIQAAGRLSPHQQSFLEDIKKRGGVAFKADDLKTVIDELEEYLKITN